MGRSRCSASRGEQRSVFGKASKASFYTEDEAHALKTGISVTVADDEGQWSRAYLHQHTAAGMEVRWKSKQWKGNRLTLPYAETGLRLCKLPKPQQAFEAAQEIE